MVQFLLLFTTAWNISYLTIVGIPTSLIMFSLIYVFLSVLQPTGVQCYNPTSPKYAQCEQEWRITFFFSFTEY